MGGMSAPPCRSEEDTDENCITYDDMFRNYDSENNSEGRGSPEENCNVKDFITSLHFNNPLEERILSRRKASASQCGEKKAGRDNDDNDDGEAATHGDNGEEETSPNKEAGATVGEANGSACHQESKEDLFGSNPTRVGVFPMESSTPKQSLLGQNYHFTSRAYKNGGTSASAGAVGVGTLTAMMMPPDPFANENSVMKKFPSLGVLESEDEKVEKAEKRAENPEATKGLPPTNDNRRRAKKKDSLKSNATAKRDGSDPNVVPSQTEQTGNHSMNGPLNEFPYDNPMQTTTPPGSTPLSRSICIKKNPLNDNYQEVDFTTSALRRKTKSGEGNKLKRRGAAPKYLMLKVDTFELNKMTKSKLKHPPVGLVNLGNTCYLNSLLQALYSTVSFVVNLYLFNIREEPKEGGGEPCSNPFAEKESPASSPQGGAAQGGGSKMNTLSKQNTLSRLNTLNGTTPTNQVATAESERFLQELKNLYIIMTTTKKTYVSPDCILGLLPHELNNRNQQDVTELLRYIFDKLGGSSREFLRLIFSGVLVQKVQCQKCFFVSKKEEVIHDLSFPVPVKASERLSIQKFFDTFVQKEKIHGSNKYRCSKCNKKRNALKWNEIISPPCHLILILNRYNWSFSSNEKKKVKTHVKVNSKIVVNNFDYKLYGGIIHGGTSASSGHYYFIGKKSERDPQDEANDWYQMDDSVVSKTSSKSINRISKDPSNDHTPYVLFYRCKQAPLSPALHF
ncbi:ubiquitin carboxyl-terminal hydrolase [Plasmodium vivax North Korean]|nr:ubiquitin carboxyl-terminal hydrolase [Plasmodium vivax North Korean]